MHGNKGGRCFLAGYRKVQSLGFAIPTRACSFERDRQTCIATAACSLKTPVRPTGAPSSLRGSSPLQWWCTTAHSFRSSIAQFQLRAPLSEMKREGLLTYRRSTQAAGASGQLHAFHVKEGVRMRERLETPDREGQRGTGASAARGLVHVGGRQPAQAGGIRAPFEVSMLIEQPSATVTSCAVRPGAEPRLVELSALALEFSAVKCSRRSFACPNVRRPRSSRPCHPERARPPGAPKLGARKLAIPSIAKKAFSFSVPAPSSSICPHTFCCNKSQRLQQPRVKLRGSIRRQVANSFVPGDAFACYSWYRGDLVPGPACLRLAQNWCLGSTWMASALPPRPAARPATASRVRESGGAERSRLGGWSGLLASLRTSSHAISRADGVVPVRPQRTFTGARGAG